MKFCRVLLSGLLITSSFILSASNHGVYYNELKNLKKAPITKALFDEDLDGGSSTTQCNLGMYRPIFCNDNDLVSLLHFDELRRVLSLGSIQRNIAIGKEISFLNQLLQVGLSDINADLVIVTAETMPSLYNYVDSLAKKANISTPVMFVSLKKEFVKAFSRKVCMFTGSIVVGQQLLHDLSDEELEAVIAQQIAHIKYHHSNKKFFLNFTVATVCVALLVAQLLFKQGDGTNGLKIDLNLEISMSSLNSRLFSWFAIPVLSSLICSKRFEKQVDMFACKEAGRSDGLIKFYERLQGKDQLRATEFDVVSKILQDNAADINILTYLGLNMQYYLAKAEHCIVGTYNKFAYPSHEARIAVAKEYLAMQEGVN